MKRSLLVVMLFLGTTAVFGQGFNNNSQKSYININMPKTPESAAFEKYGNIPLDEFSGTASITVPLYTVQGKFLSVPVTLNYHASGIKVNQEATWVGLGFDLTCGGRITVETKGNADANVRGITSQESFKTGVRRIFNKWKLPYSPNPNSPQLGYAFLDYAKEYGTNNNPWDHMNDTLWDDNGTISNSAWYGAGEPDIYHASFLGQSVDFYFDLINGTVQFLGEKSLFSVSSTTDYTGAIQSFTIKDNSGIVYLFEQKEKTKVSVMPTFGFASNIESNSAWLLTRVTHPAGDEIVFTYTNYGKTYPAFTWSASYSMSLPYSGTSSSNEPPNQVEQEPYYLSKIESGTTALDFVMSNREDLRGPGAKKLDRIDVKDKNSNTLIKEIVFNYDYFTTPLEPYENTLADTIKNYYGKRLKLLTVKDNNGPGNTPWMFSYKSLTGPSKLSFSQDHWGYYNGAPNALYGSFPATTDPLRLVPSFYSLGNLATRNIGPTIYSEIVYVGQNQTLPSLNAPSSSATIPTAFDGVGDRNCSPANIQAFMLDSITYPTGGSSKFEFEPHKSYYQAKNITDFTGGGLRVKSIKNYSSPGKLENSTEYDYMNSGIYLGAIEYLRIATKWPIGQSIVLSSFGDKNNDKQAVGYTMVKKIIKNNANAAQNGYTIKYFKADHPNQIVYSNVIHPFSPYFIGGLDCGSTDKSFLLKQWSDNAPVPKKDLDGKMYKEEVYDNAGVKVASSEYYYRQAQQTNAFYSLRVADNYLGYQGQIGFQHPGGTGYFDVGKGFDGYCGVKWNRWETCITPNVSYYTVLDSVVTKTLGVNGTYLTNKKIYKYNSFYQPEYLTTIGSDGSESVVFTQTPLSFVHPSVPSPGEGEALIIEQMKLNHIYDLPIEQIALKRSATGDSLVSGGVYNVYEGTKLKQVHMLETATPLTWRTQFAPAYYYHNYPALPSFNVVKDSKYKLQESAEYTPASLVKDIITLKGKKAFLWDETNNLLMAACENASSADISFTSFETSSNGNWTYAGPIVTDVSAPTGSKAYSLAGGAVSRNADVSKSFIVSYWSKNGPQTVSGGSSYTTGRTVNGYTYYEHKVPAPAAGSIQVSGTGTIDELRAYPENTLMVSYSYKPLVGISAQCDINNRISYYEYDASNRLSIVRDQDKNILKKICYNYAGQPENCLGNCATTTANWQNTTSSLRCQLNGSGQNTGYQEQEQKDMNPCSPTYNQLRWIVAGYNATACPLPPACNSSNCTGNDKKCINGVCETGIWSVISSYRPNKTSSWTCVYAYCFSDGSTSTYTQSVTSPTMCIIDCYY